MKIILTAFNGKLKSDPMDWPENTPTEVCMIMTMPRLPVNWNSDLEIATKTINKKGRFQATPRWFSFGGEAAQEYVLVDIS